MSGAAGHHAVIVITGASGGLGRAVAIQFASAGLRVGLAARRLQDLEETARLCERAGGQAQIVVTDVTQEAQVEALCAAIMARWGRIDVWVNNAGVTLFARLDEASFAEHRRVIEVNLFGAVLCARAVLPIFKRQGYGVLINVGSVLSKVGQPYVPSYVISKFGLRGLSEALRAELAEQPKIHVCTVLPYAIDTPHFQSGANHMGTHARAMPPVQSPEKVARRIVKLAKHPKRETHVPRVVVLGLALRWVLPHTTERLLLRALTRWHFDNQVDSATTGNLYAPVELSEARVHGVRPPQLSTARFATWTVKELMRLWMPTPQRARGQSGRKAATPIERAQHG
jgi:short-subunit dehydrogenase